MVFSSSKLACLALGAFGLMAATPALADSTELAPGVIDLTQVDAGSNGGDAQFQQMFATWEEPAGRIAPAIAVPSRMPLEDARLTSDYGIRTHPVLGGKRKHNGIDLAAPTGTPIYATADGYVSKAGPFSSYGNYVSIEHGAGLETRYAHMSRVVAHEGARVQKGDLIGYVGSTGRSTGPHLHYEIRVDGNPVNPIPYMAQSPAQAAFAMNDLDDHEDH